MPVRNFLLAVLLLTQAPLQAQPIESGVTDSTDIRTAIGRGLHWIETHPASLQDGGLTDLIDEGVAFYLFQRLARQPEQRRYFQTALQQHMAALDALPEFSQWARQPHKRLLDHYHLVLAAWLMQRAGEPSTVQAEIVRRAQYALASTRSPLPSVPLTIAVFLQHLGEPSPISLDNLLRASLTQRIADGKAPVLVSGTTASPQQRHSSRVQVYALIHEVVALTDFGRLAPPAWLAKRRTAVIGFLRTAMHQARTEGNIDLLAEILGSLFFLQVPPDATIHASLQELVNHQLPDGSWGDQPLDRQNKRRHAVHTATAALWAYGQVHPLPPSGSQAGSERREMQ